MFALKYTHTHVCREREKEAMPVHPNEHCIISLCKIILAILKPNEKKNKIVHA